MDRRIKSRIDVQLMCYVGAGKVRATPVRAFTENVSRTGMLMRWAKGVPLPPVDGKLMLDVQLPENSEFGPRVMRCRASVVRVTRSRADEHEVALRILSMRFVKGAREASRPVPYIDLASMPLLADRII
jgi:c-di-GMP-binding flagellar brake protein YcgR